MVSCTDWLICDNLHSLCLRVLSPAIEHRSSTHTSSTRHTQHTSHAPLTLQQHHLTHQSQSHSSHSHSAHQELHPLRERTPEKAHHRALVPHLSHHSSPTHNHSHSSSNPSSFSSSHSESQLVRGENARLLSARGDPLLVSSQMLGRSPELSKIAEQRRKSADSAFFHTHEQDIQGHHNYSRRHDHAQSQLHRDPITTNKAKTQFEELSNSDDPESGFSHKWEEPTLNPADIVITLNDGGEEDGDRSKSNSSSSTLIESGSPPREGKEKHLESSLQPGRQHQNIQQELSQERFGDDDHKEMISTLAEGHGTLVPLSNCAPYYEPYYTEYQEGFPPHSFTTKQEQNQSQSQVLSQPSSSSPPKSRHGKSMTDLTSSNGSLSCSQPFLSQSVTDFQHMQQRHTESSRHLTTNQRRPHEHRFRGPPPLSHMSSDPHFNKNYVPGLQRSIVYALSDVKEEGEQSKQHSRGKKRSTSMLRSSPQSQPHRSPHSNSSLQKKHVKATVVRKHSQKRTGPDSLPHDKK